MSEKKCSKCSETFTCKHEETGCWCEQVELNMEALNYLKEHYDNCLCPVCLKAFEAQFSKNVQINK
jgi:hypothetical protein